MEELASAAFDYAKWTNWQRRLLACLLGCGLFLAGCSTNPYAEVSHRKPYLAGPLGTGVLAMVEQTLTRATREERT